MLRADANYSLRYLLTIQAHTVPCERVFSPSKETCSRYRSQLGSTTIEKFQILKHLYRRERLNFTAGLVSVEEDYVIDGPITDPAICELLKAGKEGELRDLYNGSPEQTRISERIMSGGRALKGLKADWWISRTAFLPTRS